MAGPTPVSALIHAATMVTAGIYMVARNNILYTLSPVSLNLVLFIGLATALFAAWVDGRVAADPTIHPAAVPEPDEADPRRQWLARWNAVVSGVAKATGGTTGLVDQLRHDRR